MSSYIRFIEFFGLYFLFVIIRTLNINVSCGNFGEAVRRITTYKIHDFNVPIRAKGSKNVLSANSNYWRPFRKLPCCLLLGPLKHCMAICAVYVRLIWCDVVWSNNGWRFRGTGSFAQCGRGNSPETVATIELHYVTSTVWEPQRSASSL